MTDLSTILARLDANPNAMYSARAVAKMLRDATDTNVKAVDVTVAGLQNE